MTDTIRQAPALKCDEDTVLHPNGTIERRIVWNLLSKLWDAGFEVVSVHDGDEVTRCHENTAAMEAIFAVDDAYLFVRKRGTRGRAHNRFIKLVGGNVEDIISDYSAVDTDGFATFMETFKPSANW